MMMNSDTLEQDTTDTDNTGQIEVVGDGQDNTGAAQGDPPDPVQDAKPRSQARLDLVGAVLTLDGIPYALSDLAEPVRAWLGLRGLVGRLLSVEDRAAAWQALRDGKTPADRVSGVKEIDAWRRAYALALADRRCKDEGAKSKSPEAATILAAALESAAKLDRVGVANAKKIPAVVTHWNKLTGHTPALI